MLAQLAPATVEDIPSQAVAALAPAQDAVNGPPVLAVLFNRIGRPEIAATVYGACIEHGIINTVINLPSVVDHLRDALGESVFNQCVASGADIERSDAVRFAQRQIQHARQQLRNVL